jgi:hypothetical protein
MTVTGGAGPITGLGIGRTDAFSKNYLRSNEVNTLGAARQSNMPKAVALSGMVNSRERRMIRHSPHWY